MKKHPKALKLINKYLKSLSTQKASDGFTLIELLLAASITTIVISLTGFGLVAMTQRDKTAKAEIQSRVELNRALDFISDEIKQAKAVTTNTTAASAFTASFDTPAKTRIPVLTLEIPRVPQRVVYYIAPKASTSPWLGPNLVYRWGPRFQANGQYEPTDLDNPNTDPATWPYEPLADLIVNTAPSPAPSCPSPTSLNPPSGITGFYACVDPNGRSAAIYLRGKLTDAYGNSRVPLEVSTKAFARTVDAPPPPPNTTPNLTFTTSGGTVTFTQSSSAFIQVLGGEITCGAGGPRITTTTTLNVTPPGGSTTSTTVSSSLSFSAASGSTLTVTGTAQSRSCTGSDTSYNSATTSGKQVFTLRNGDRPPLFTPFGGQPDIDSFLDRYLNPDGTVKIADNQVIFLYELGATSRSSAAYDMQDLVVLATVSPS